MSRLTSIAGYSALERSSIAIRDEDGDGDRRGHMKVCVFAHTRTREGR